ncbi:MAG: substrate-binding domain-containing protein [Planctomyces sp.]|nr:substrate-binding domain-containing protein [Planctomyces sp.]
MKSTTQQFMVSFVMLSALVSIGCGETSSDAAATGGTASSSAGSGDATGGGSGDAVPEEPPTGLEEPTQNGNSNGSSRKRGTIAFSTLTLTNPFFKVIADTMKAEAEKHGYEVIVVSGEQDVSQQTSQVEDFIVKGVSAIVLNPCDSSAIGEAIRKANAAGIPVFTNDIKYAGTDAEVVCHVATDNYQGGKLAGDAMVKLLGETGGRVAVIGYPDVESCQLRVKGFMEVVDAHNAAGESRIEVVKTLDGRGAREPGHAAAQDAIEAHPDLNAIFAINDPSALGAYVAVEAANKTKQIQIIGFDGAYEGKKAILEGKILCDPVQFPDEMGRTTIAMILKYFEGEEVPREVLIPSKLYYREDAMKDPELSK